VRRAPHFALRGLYHRASAAMELSAHLSESETLADRLFVELAQHPLVAPSAFGRLADSVDVSSPLQRALERIARLGPPHSAERRIRALRVANAELRTADDAMREEKNIREAVPHEDGKIATGAPGSGVADDERGVRKILSNVEASSASTVSSKRQPRAGTRSGAVAMPWERRTGERAETAPARAVSVADVRARRDAWLKKAGSDRPVASAEPDDGVVADLIAGRDVPTAALIQAAAPSASAEPPGDQATSPLQQTVLQLGAALDRIAARAAGRSVSPPSYVRSEPFGIGAEHTDRTGDRATLDLADAQASGLHRLAMRMGTSVRRAAGDAGEAPSRWAQHDRPAFPESPAPGAEPDDNTLATRLADILAREARRHGIETEGIEP